MDEGKYVQLVGRQKDVIIRGGENVYPAEVEEFIFTHPKVTDVHVIGVPDHRMGEEVCAWIRLHDGQNCTDTEIREFCEGKIFAGDTMKRAVQRTDHNVVSIRRLAIVLLVLSYFLICVLNLAPLLITKCIKIKKERDPLTVTGKVQKYKMKEIAKKELDLTKVDPHLKEDINELL